MPLHPLVHSGVLHTLQRMTDRIGPVLLESLPDVAAVSEFFDTLQRFSFQSIDARLYFDPADHTVYVSHSHKNVSVHLSTVTHDYTSNCRHTFAENWQNPTHVGSPQLISQAIDHFDDLQRHLLQMRPAYLHHISAHNVLNYEHARNNESPPAPPSNSHFKVFTAYRFASLTEPPLLEPRAATWKPYNRSGVVRIATAAEATVWAVEHLVSSNPQLDLFRLRHISAVVRAVFSAKPFRRTIPCGNTTALLSARQCASRSNYGRVRHPIIQAAVHDNSLIRDSTPFVSGAEEPTCVLPPVVNTRKFRIIRLAFSLIFLTIFIALALHYTLVDTRQLGVVKIVLWIIVFITVIELIYNIFAPRPPSTASDLLRLSKRFGTRAQVEVATGVFARSMYNGAWLSFSGLSYAGQREYDGPCFRVSDLLTAGYELAFCMDGREALITPKRNPVRMKAIGSDGGAVFARAESEDPQLTTAVVPGVRGTWAADISMGRPAKASEFV